MNYQSLYRSYRPRRFTEMVGQQAVVTSLKNQTKTGRIAHAYLFFGSRGTGKTSAARIMAMAINCKNPQEGDPCLVCENCQALSNESTLDVFEMDAASNSRVEEIREMLTKTDYPPQFVKYKVYIIDEVHMLSNAAFNALLKTLEEPPEYMVFILATTEPQKLPATILSRCQRFDFGRISESEIISRLRLALKDGITAQEGALQLIAASAEGSMRDAWSLMDMCLGVQTDLSEESVREAMGAMSQEFLFDFLDALREYNSSRALLLVDELMRKGRDVQVFLRDFAAHLRQVIAVKWTGKGIRETTGDNLRRFEQQADNTTADALLRMLEACMLSETESRWSSSPRAVLEIYALKVCQLEQAQDLDGLLARIQQLETQLAALRSGEASKQAKRTRQPEPKLSEKPPVMAQAPAANSEKHGDRQTYAVPAAAPEPEQGAKAAQTKKDEIEPLANQQEPRQDQPLPASLPEPQTESEKAGDPSPSLTDSLAAAELPLAKEKTLPATTPKDAWNKMLTLLKQQNQGLYSMINRGKYGGYENQTFTLLFGKEDDIMTTIINKPERANLMESMLSQQMGIPVRFEARGPNGTGRVVQLVEEQPDEHLEALARVFGRDKIIVKKANP